ncbi:MAG TPA: glycosyltransferase family 2 protein [Planctomycetota bacterium]
MGGSDKLPISVVVIAQNEAAHVGDCLVSAGFAAELLVLDGGSDDQTVAIALRAGARVEQRAFDGWISQKNAALEMARQDWVLSLDADERVSPGLAAEIRGLFSGSGPDADGYEIPRRAFHLGRWIRGGGWYPDRKLRLIRRGKGCWTGRDPHDRLTVAGRVRRLQQDLLHYPYADLAAHVARMDRYTTAAAQAAFEAGRGAALLRMVVTPPLRFLKAYLVRGGFRDGRAGLVLAVLAAEYERMRYAKLWDLQRRARGSGRAER